ncbi:hypothetical protein GJ496_007447 [Pomphorhynchus laevis]|nr:hypothetical protein GJ496_007447 [Pomphorhynchus laevis]
MSMLRRIYTIPNLLALSRIATCPITSFFIISQENYKIASCVTAYAVFSDWADGYIARKFPSQASQLGSIIDPLADKCFAVTLSSSLWYVNLFPGWLLSLLLVRDVGLVFGTLKYSAINRIKSITVQPSLLSKINTLLLFALFTGILTNEALKTNMQSSINLLQYCVGATTISSGLMYALKPGIKCI